MKHFYTALLLLLTCWSTVLGQQTVGLFENSAESYDGYTLFAPMTNNTTYLINNCGEKVHSWPSTKLPGLSAYILEDGTLLRTGKVSNASFSGGGSGGTFDMIDWSGSVIWTYTISSTTEYQHHDVEYLPNGNILAIAWEAKTDAEATAAGRSVVGSNLWPEKIVEIEPDLSGGGGTVVWEWHVWDHLVQDADSTKDNFGSVSGSPELININYTGGPPTNADWLHINGVDYNAALDQIVLSVHNTSEIWIIDHSTSTSEAAGHTGGNSGKGGDLLYRWGNPEAYDNGSGSDQLLNQQHDARWIEDSLPNAGMIMVFNNKAGSPSNYSEVNIIDPPLDISGNYSYSGGAYGPATYHWTYRAATPTDFYSSNISGAHPLPGGNTLICEGSKGRLFEVDSAGNTVWEYVNPVNISGVINQGSPAFQNNVFRCTRYALDYSGFTGKTLTPDGYIETGSTFSCTLFTSAEENIAFENQIKVFPNPSNASFTLTSVKEISSMEMFDVKGRLVKREQGIGLRSTIQIEDLPEGLYFIRLYGRDGSTAIEKVMVSR